MLPLSVVDDRCSGLLFVVRCALFEDRCSLWLCGVDRCVLFVGCCLLCGVCR